MKYIVLLFLPVHLLFGNKNEDKINPIHYFDLLHTDLNLRPNWEKHQMEGEAVLKLVPYFYAQNKIILDAKEFDISQVAIKRGKTKLALDFNYNKKKLIIFLDKLYTRNDSFEIYIKYVANPDSIKSTDGKAIAEERGLYFINTNGKRKNVPTQLWTQGETESNSAWFPTFDHPSEKHTQKIKITYDKKYVSLSNGKLTSSVLNGDGTKTDIWTQTLPHSVYLTVLVIGEFKIVKDQWRGKEISYYMEPKYEHLARPIFGRAPEMMEYFSKKLGVDYPWDKFSNVILHDFVAGAMENTSAVTYASILQKDLRELLDENDDETVVHELFHHWFGNLVTCESWLQTTLNESFANYSEYLWHEYKYGIDAAQNHWQRDLSPYFSISNSKREPLVREKYEKADDMFDIISYNKGGKILHMLRNYMGDEAFFMSLKLYLNRYAYKTAEYSNLRNCFEEVTGEDLNWFFDQWYLKGGHPVIASSHKIVGDSVWLFIAQKHNFDTSFIYKLYFDLDLYTVNGIEHKRIKFDSKKDSFLLKIKGFKTLILDGTNSIVAIKNESKTMEQWMYILRNSKNYLDKANAIKKLNSKKGVAEVQKLIYETLSSNQPQIVSAAIKLIEEDWMQNDDKWVGKLIEISKMNSRGSTRAVALEKLAAYSPLDTLKELIIEKLKDSSYLVEAEALKMYSKIDSAGALNYAMTCTKYNHYGILAKVFELIGRTKNPDMLKLFEEGIEHSEGYKRLVIYSRFGTYIASQSDEVFNAKIEEFKLLVNSKTGSENYSGSYALGALKTELKKMDDERSKQRLERAEEILKNIKDEENDVH